MQSNTIFSKRQSILPKIFHFSMILDQMKDKR